MKFVKILKQLILEAKNTEELLNTYAYGEKKSDKGKVKRSLMTPEELMVIIANDPTSRIKGLRPENVVNQLYNPTIKDSQDYIDLGLEAVEKPGDYTEWIITQLRKLAIKVDQEVPFKENREAFERAYQRARRLFFEDLFKVKQDLIRFHANKKTDRIEKKDINQYANFDELESVVASLPLETATTTRSERRESKVHPGAEMVFESPNWDIIKIERQDELGREAACFYGGNQLRKERGETNWCTSAPNASGPFKNYISKGPLFVLIPKGGNTTFGPKDVGDISGLPSRRYQFHFEDKQFMDPDDSQIDLLEFFGPGGEMEELKEFFRPYFGKIFLKGENTNNKTFKLEYPSGGASKYAAIYGLDTIIDSIPDSITTFEVINKSNTPLDLKIDEDFVKKFSNLKALHLHNAVSSLPSNLGDLNLKFLAVTNSKNIDEIPQSVDRLVEDGTLTLASFAGSNPNLKLPEKLQKALEDGDIIGYFG
jgi:hypothetical protein